MGSFTTYSPSGTEYTEFIDALQLGEVPEQEFVFTVKEVWKTVDVYLPYPAILNKDLARPTGILHFDRLGRPEQGRWMVQTASWLTDREAQEAIQKLVSPF